MPRTNDHHDSDLPAGHVSARILPLGDGKVFTGEFDPLTQQFTRHAKGAVIALPAAIARALELRGFAEVL
jgi:hypothetical protein